MDRGLSHCAEGSDQDDPQEKEKQKAKEKRNYIPIWTQSTKEEQGEIRKPS